MLLEEVLSFLITDPKGVYIDGTAGEGGHSEAIAKMLPGGRLILMDGDSEVLNRARERLKNFNNVEFINRDFSHMDEVVKEGVSGILLDLGLSSYHLEFSGRGFSYERDEPLDMRFNKREAKTAKEVINKSPEGELVKIFREFGDVPGAKKLVKNIVRKREEKPIETTGELLSIVLKTYPYRKWRKYASRVFMALRMAVNKELDKIKTGITKGVELLAPRGRMLVISYHSKEDRIVKELFKEAEKLGKGIVLTKKPIQPTEDEIKSNPRSRSAKLRIFEKL